MDSSSQGYHSGCLRGRISGRKAAALVNVPVTIVRQMLLAAAQVVCAAAVRVM